MSGSRRDILDGATANPANGRGPLRPGEAQRRPAAQLYSAAEARGLLERELAAFSDRLGEDRQASAPARAMDHRPAPAPASPAEYRPAAAPVRPQEYRPAPARARPEEHRRAASYARPIEDRPAPASARPIDPRPAGPVEYRAAFAGPAAYMPAPAPARTLDYSPPAAPAAPAEYRLAPVPAGPLEEMLAAGDEKVPYHSLMAALSTATPDMLTEAEKSVTLAIAEPMRTPPVRSPERLSWRSLLAISALAVTAGLSAYAFLSRGGNDAGTSQTAQAPSAADPNAVWVNVPLPSRRPPALRAQQSPAPSAPGSATN